MKVTFDMIQVRSEARIKCPKCGKTRNKVFKDYQTENPWNCDPVTKIPRTRSEIYANVSKKVQQDIKKAQASGIVCAKCKAIK